MSCQRREQEKQPTDQADDKTRLKSIIKPLKIKIQSRFQREQKGAKNVPPTAEQEKQPTDQADDKHAENLQLTR